MILDKNAIFQAKKILRRDIRFTGALEVTKPLSLFEKIWKAHEVVSISDEESLIYIDKIFLHERTGSIALQSLHGSGRTVRHPSKVFCTMDHIVDTFPGRDDKTLMPGGTNFIVSTRKEASKAGINLFDLNDPRQGISHVVAAESGIALPGSTLVCPDSHTCTLGGIGLLAWGIGSTEAEHALATSTLRVKKPRSMKVIFDGMCQPGVTAKDMILFLISQYGVSGGAGYAIEFTGTGVSGLEPEARMTLCNMAVEFSAFTGFVAPDQKTVEYVIGRDFAPRGADLRIAEALWQNLHTDTGTFFDKEIFVDCAKIRPTVSWGTNPSQVIPIAGKIPKLEMIEEVTDRLAAQKALKYMDLEPGMELRGLSIDGAFIGSCTNSRLSDLRLAANFLRGKKVSSNVSAICVPGSTKIKIKAEEEGLDKIFIDAGFEWREAGCSMCFYAGGETFGAGKRIVSSTNRNFEGRQGPNTRTHIASPLTVAASACAGSICGAYDA